MVNSLDLFFMWSVGFSRWKHVSLFVCSVTLKWQHFCESNFLTAKKINRHKTKSVVAVRLKQRNSGRLFSIWRHFHQGRNGKLKYNTVIMDGSGGLIRPVFLHITALGSSRAILAYKCRKWNRLSREFYTAIRCSRRSRYLATDEICAWKIRKNRVGSITAVIALLLENLLFTEMCLH